MTIQLAPPMEFGKSKKTLELALNVTPVRVRFYNPGILLSYFSGQDITPGEFPVCLDHPKRMRFAIVVRKPDGTFKVR